MTSAGKRKPRNARASVMGGALGGGGDGSAAPTRSGAAAQRNRSASPQDRALPGGSPAQPGRGHAQARRAVARPRARGDDEPDALQVPGRRDLDDGARAGTPGAAWD